ncbi:MAG: hypothetical protein QM658_03450 [Gordonia sp. (in: high G+C Gram-positive bacteria)]
MSKGIAIIIAAAVVFFAGWIVGGSWATGTEKKARYEQMTTCLPIADQAKLDTCWNGDAR